ncbi:MAG: sulfite exporter TauE/SafE family protein, partial [Planctomycetota bacterium]
MPPEYLFVVAVFFVASLTRATFGFGEALIAMPLLAFVMPITTVATPLVALNATAMALVIVVQDWRHIHLGSAWRLLAATLVGAPIGLWWLTSISEFSVKLLLAILIVSFSTFSLARAYWLQRHPPPPASSSEEPADKDWLAWVFGFFAGLIGSVYLTFGPPLVIYGAIRGWKPQQFRATLQGYFLIAGLCVLPMHAS